MDAGALRGPIDGLVGGRDVIVTAHAVRGIWPLVDAVRSHGAGRILVLAGSEGTGDRPADVAEVVVGLTVRSMTEEVLALESLVDHLTAEHHAALDAWDPERRAVALALPLLVADEIGGRPVLGARRPEGADLEDKATCDALCAAAGVPVPPHEVVPPELAGVAAARLEATPGAGVVVSAGGRNGGADGVRWVAVEDAAATATELAGAFAGARGPGLGLVRVAPFVEGVPCSIGALVTADGVAVLRPVENLTLRRGRRLLYSGLATAYDPPPAVRAAMEAAARRVGEELRRRVDHRGGFSIDGIVTADSPGPLGSASPGASPGPLGSASPGWLATEVNVRLSGGFSAQPTGGDEPLLPLLQAALVERVADDVLTAAAIEAVYRPVAEATRSVRVARVIDAVPAGGPVAVGVVADGRAARVAAPGEPVHGTLAVGASATGGVVVARLTDAERPLVLGPPAAPLAVALLDLADELWATGTAGLAPPDLGRS